MRTPILTLWIKIKPASSKRLILVSCVSKDTNIVDVTGKEALLVYQDDSSDEMEDVMNDLLVPASDTDDDFDEEEGDETMEVSLFHHLTLFFFTHLS